MFLILFMIWLFDRRDRVMVFNTTFNNISLYCGCKFYWWRKLEYPENPTDLLHVTDTLSHIKMLYQVHLAISGFELTMIVVIATDYIAVFSIFAQ